MIQKNNSGFVFDEKLQVMILVQKTISNSNSKSNVLFVVFEHLVQRRSNYAFTSVLESRLDYA